MRSAAWFALAAASCTVDRSALDDRAFACDVTDPAPTCGDGYVCYGASGVGSADFCVPECDGPAESENAVCTADGEQLERCTPGQACNIEGLACMRTDLIEDRGLCLDLTPCTVDSDCRDPERNRCASTVFPEIFPNADLHTDQLYCMERCADSWVPGYGDQCLSGVCLDQLTGGLVPAICAPPCDSTGRCPPTFTCFGRVLPQLRLPYCVPGLPGYPCFSNTDCLGSCHPLIEGALHVCVTACGGDDDCIPLDRQINPDDPDAWFLYACHEGRCLSPMSLFFTFCSQDADCGDPARCLLVEEGDTKFGVCVTPCDGEDDCPPLGGLPMGCVPVSLEGDGVCVPALGFVPCEGSDDDCVGELVCSDLLKDVPEVGSSVCTLPCQASGDCAQNRWLGEEWYCGNEVFSPIDICAPKLENGGECFAQDVMCRSDACIDGMCRATRVIGEPCRNDCQCLGGWCEDGECRGALPGGACKTDCNCPCGGCVGDACGACAP